MNTNGSTRLSSLSSHTQQYFKVHAIARRLPESDYLLRIKAESVIGKGLVDAIDPFHFAMPYRQFAIIATIFMDPVAVLLLDMLSA